MLVAVVINIIPAFVRRAISVWDTVIWTLAEIISKPSAFWGAEMIITLSAHFLR
jgi:hypothetical protein